MTTCPYCFRLVDYSNHLHECGAVLSACGLTPDRSDQSIAAQPCARAGCHEPRTLPRGPYCRGHRLEVERRSRLNNQQSRNAKARARYHATKGTE